MPVKELQNITPQQKAEGEARKARTYADSRPASIGYVAKKVDATMEAIAGHLVDLRQAVRSLEGQLELLQHKSIRYEGTHMRGEQYNQGSIVTAKGTIWHCEKTTASEPGRSSDWKMMAKSVQTARGAK